MSTLSHPLSVLSHPRAKALLLPLVILLLWFAISARALVNPVLIPSPRVVLHSSLGILHTGEFWSGLGISLARTLSGFILATLLGGAIGVLLGGSLWAGRIVGPTFHAFRQIAPFAWVPLISAWFGAGEFTKVAFITVASLPAIIFNTIEGIQSLQPQHRELARTLQVSRTRFLSQVLIPTALPSIFTGLHLALVVSWLATVGAEYFLNIGPGITLYLQEGRSLARMDMVIFGIVIIGFVGFFLTWGLTRIERWALAWRPTQVSKLDA